ncbi:MAG: glycosyltransferase family A protein [Verrucomicrobiota bacterium JB023]|nr:glycosyltransferase family A protein [Verrucomicrobiota bacterium JB023]
MSFSPVVSIVIPLFNRARLVCRTIESVLAQSYDDWEVLVVDDHSTDDSFIIVDRFVNLDSRVRLFERTGDRRGACVCRNQGLEKAKGKYVIFLDSDDIMAVDALRSRVATLEADNQLDFVVSGTVIFEEQLGDVSAYRCFPHETEISDFLRFLMFDQPWLTTGPTWRKSFLDKHELHWDESLPCWQDWFFHLNVLVTEPKYQRILGFDSGWRRGGIGQISKPKKGDKRDFSGFFSGLAPFFSRVASGGGELSSILREIYRAALLTKGIDKSAFGYSHDCPFKDYVMSSWFRRFLLLQSQGLPRPVRGEMIKCFDRFDSLQRPPVKLT